MRGLFLGAALTLLAACSHGVDAGAGGSDGGSLGTSTATSTATTTGEGGAGTTTSTANVGGTDVGTGGPTWGADQCPATPPGVKVGFDVGDQMGDIVVKDCDGNDVSLTALCGASALFVFAAYGWCPLCKSVSSAQEALTDSFAGQNVASVNIVLENAQAQPADANYCKTWRAAHGQEDVVTLYDPTGAVLALWNGGGSTSYSAFIDSDRVIVSKLEHTADQNAIKAGIEGALAH
jgi:hypothetical protein